MKLHELILTFCNRTPKKQFLILILGLITLHPVLAQTSTKLYSINASDYYNNTKYDYQLSIQYRMQDANYGNRPTSLKVGLSKITITEVYYEGKRASNYLKKMQLPVTSKVFATVSGSVSVRKGSNSAKFSFVKSTDSDGGLDVYYLSSAERKKLINSLGPDINCDNVTVNMMSPKVSKIGVSVVSTIIDAMKEQQNEEAKIKKETEKREAELKEEEKRKELKRKEEEEEANRIKQKNDEAKLKEKEKEKEEKKKEEKKKVIEREKLALKKEEQIKEQETQKRKKEAERREAAKQAQEAKSRRKAEYDRRIKSQHRKNTAAATSAVAGTASALYYLGGFIYKNYGRTNNSEFSGSNGFLNFDIGFGATILPTYFASEFTSFDGSMYRTTSETERRFPLTTNLNTKLQLGYENERLGGYGFANLEGGIFPALTAFHLNANVGGRLYAGVKNIKIFGEYNTGYRSMNLSDWLLVEEAGEGKTALNYNQFKYGVKFTWYGNSYSASRNHIYLGLIKEKITPTEEEISVETIRTKTEPYQVIKRFTGLTLEWKHDHHGRLYIDLFPNYPMSGIIGGPIEPLDRESSNLFLRIGFLRSIDTFF